MRLVRSDLLACILSSNNLYTVASGKVKFVGRYFDTGNYHLLIVQLLLLRMPKLELVHFFWISQCFSHNSKNFTHYVFTNPSISVQGIGRM